MKKIVYSISITLILISILVISYPKIADIWNNYVAAQTIESYTKERESVKNTDENIEKAQEYNKALFSRGKNNIPEYTTKASGNDKDSQAIGVIKNHDEEYESLLNYDDTGLMGFISIPKISVQLPIRHYTDDNSLNTGVGHIYGSSLPVGGASTHTVLAGHSALATARIFTDLEKLKKEDTFIITVGTKTMTYKIDQILTVLPEEMEALEIEKGKDYATLVTCTPYGVNTHRLLIRGERVSQGNEEINQATEKINEQVSESKYDLYILIGILTALVLIYMIALILIIGGKNER